MNLPEWLNNMIDNVIQTFSMFTFVDAVDIACVSVLLYFAYKFIRDRRAGKLAIGVAILIGVLIISVAVELHAMQFIFQNVFQVGIISILILFQPELRSILEKMGGQSLSGIKSIGDSKDTDDTVVAIEHVCSAASDMSASKTGALIAFEKNTKIGEYAGTGTVINADVNSSLIKNIFYNKAPLHDGAVIIRNNEIYAAGCVLPLSAQSDISHDLGTRHRAAIGLTENSDALVVVVSEETGKISVAFNGVLHIGVSKTRLREMLQENLIVHSVTDVLKAKSRISKNKNIKTKKAKESGVEKVKDGKNN